MEANFKDSFLKFIQEKKQIMIFSKTNYDMMVSCIQKCAVKNQHTETLSMNEANLTRRYAIHIKQQVPMLYHIWDRGRRMRNG